MQYSSTKNGEPIDIGCSSIENGEFLLIFSSSNDPNNITLYRSMDALLNNIREHSTNEGVYIYI